MSLRLHLVALLGAVLVGGAACTAPPMLQPTAVPTAAPTAAPTPAPATPTVASAATTPGLVRAAPTGAELVEIGRRLITEHLEGYRSSNDPMARLKDFRIENVQIVQRLGDPSPRVFVSYSVLPGFPQNGWLVGNGTQGEGGWVVGKGHFLELVPTSDGYHIASMATG